ncbi:hypothetical protein FA95DRAFT_693883 [Auriscalpium vulgare]|uniref:Uncharacterized protein n=1 Tax=Auriscalpium vulgare TaxID=40419 RepID=A0ACB8RCR5_9AGAM|nr:hypothetical protein FA95DRAFT_693883 [Auriscalpium vulgare]
MSHVVRVYSGRGVLSKSRRSWLMASSNRLAGILGVRGPLVEKSRWACRLRKQDTRSEESELGMAGAFVLFRERFWMGGRWGTIDCVSGGIYTRMETSVARARHVGAALRMHKCQPEGVGNVHNVVS